MNNFEECFYPVLTNLYKNTRLLKKGEFCEIFKKTFLAEHPQWLTL